MSGAINLFFDNNSYHLLSAFKADSKFNLVKITRRQFISQEIIIEIDKSIDKNTNKNFILQSINKPIHENIFQTLLIINKLQKLNIKNINLIFSYLAYSRDFDALEMILKIFKHLNVKSIAAIDLHNNYKNKDIINVSTNNIYYKDIDFKQYDAIFSADEGGCTTVKDLATITNKPNIVLKKERFFINNQRTKSNIQTNFLNTCDIEKIKNYKKVIIVDDIIDTANTLNSAVKLLNQHNIKNIDVLITHNLYKKNLKNVINFYTTNTIKNYGATIDISPLIKDFILS